MSAVDRVEFPLDADGYWSRAAALGYSESSRNRVDGPIQPVEGGQQAGNGKLQLRNSLTNASYAGNSLPIIKAIHPN